MAEVVHRELEDMLPFLEDMEKHGLFSRDEIKSIIKKRRDFEYLLKRRQSLKKDYLHYIQYELNLDTLRRKRKVRLGMVRQNTKSEYSIVRHVHYIFNRMLKKFPDDYKLWLQYFDLCRRMGSARVLGAAYARALAHHMTVPELWVEAAKYEFEENANIRAARVLMQRGLRLNKDSQLLWREYFRLELLYWEKMCLRRKVLGLELPKLPENEKKENGEENAGVLDHMETESTGDGDRSSVGGAPMNLDNEGEEGSSKEALAKFYAGEVPMIVCQNAAKAHPTDVHFRMAFIDIYRLFDGTESMQMAVMDSLKQELGASEHTWDAVARYYAQPDGDSTDVERALGVYRQAVKDLPTPTMHDLRTCYLSEILEHSTSDNVHTSRQQLLAACQQAASAGLATPALYRLWSVTLLRAGQVNDAVSVVEEGAGRHPTNIELTRWAALLSARAKVFELPAHADAAFQRAVAANRGDGQTWLLWIDYVLATGAEGLDQKFNAAVQSSSDRDVILLTYVDWAMHTGGIKAVRKLCARLQKEGLGTVAMCTRCITLERQQHPLALDKIRALHEWAVQTEPENEDLWYDYIQTEQQARDFTRAAALHRRATKSVRDPRAFQAREMLNQCV